MRAGQTVKAGETVFTANMPDYDAAMEELQTKYDAKAAELLDKDIENLRTDKDSTQNELYEAVLDKQTALSQAEHDARVLAVGLGITLGTDSTQWKRRADGQDELLAAVQSALDAQAAYDKAYNSFFRDYKRSSTQFKDTTFKYVKERDALLSDMNDLMDDMVALSERQNTLTNVTAPHDGYVVAIGLKSGDTYDGKTSAFTLSDEDAARSFARTYQPCKVISDGTKVEVSSSYGTEKTSVENTALDADERSTLHNAFGRNVISAKGG